MFIKYCYFDFFAYIFLFCLPDGLNLYIVFFEIETWIFVNLVNDIKFFKKLPCRKMQGR